MAPRVCTVTQALPTKDGLVQIGELTLHHNGQCYAGNRVFDVGVPIDGHVFGGTCLLRRRIDEPQRLEIWDGSQYWDLHYDRFLAAWFQVLPFESELYERLIDRFGPRLASPLYLLTLRTRRLGTDALMLFGSLVWSMVEQMRALLVISLAILPWMLVMWAFAALRWLLGQ